MPALALRRLLFVATLSVVAAATAMTPEERRAHLDWMRQNLPAVPAWDEWQQKTGGLPPDFDALPRANFLPDPFRFADGRTVTMPADWTARRAEIRALYERHIIGRLPPRPKIARVVPVEENKGEGYGTRTVRLEFGPDGKGTIQVTVTIPSQVDGDLRAPSSVANSQADGARRSPSTTRQYPVLIGTGWTAPLIRRGYASCSYSGSVDQRSNLRDLYPDFDFSTMAERAWFAQLVVDYLHTIPEIDRARIAITGYSREGKMATIAAALDDRIAAVIAGSTGVGGVLPWRLSGEHGGGEGVESTTRMFPLWFAPQLRFFAGREDRLPVDANLLVALIAPRACLMEYGLNDEVSNVWANEQCYHSALKVFDALGQPGRLGLMRLPGFHGANDQELCLDWLDIQFGRSARTWKNDLLFPWSFDTWRQRGAVNLTALPPQPKHGQVDRATPAPDETRRAIQWMLGPTPPKVAVGPGRGGFPGRGPSATATKPVANPGQLAPDVAGWVIARSSQEFGWLAPEKDQLDSKRIRFGNGITGDLYFPKGTPENAKLPAAIWLHGYSYPLGYMWVYRRDLHPILALMKAGYAVLAFDQCGFGARMSEIGPFYDRYPQWSQLGRMVDDTRAAIDAVEKETMIDAQRVHLFGYTLGGTVALHTAALDPRVKSVVSIAGFTPMRTDTRERGTGGIARYSHERPLLPRLGLFVGREQEIPYDYGELLAAIAPRPVLIVQPSMDRDAHPADVRAAVATARKVYAQQNAADRLGLQEPNDYQRLTNATQSAAIEWMKGQR